MSPALYAVAAVALVAFGLWLGQGDRNWPWER